MKIRISKKMLFLVVILLSTALVARELYPRLIQLSQGESINIGDTQISCGENQNPGGPGSQPSENFYLNGTNYQITLNWQNAVVRNMKNGESFPLGGLVLRTPKAIIFDNQVYFFGVGLDEQLYYQVGLKNGNWIPTRGILLGGSDNFKVLNLRNSFILFGIGLDHSFYAYEFFNNGKVSGWINLNGSGPSIEGLYPIGDDDYRIVVIGTDGQEYSRTRNTGFARF